MLKIENKANIFHYRFLLTILIFSMFTLLSRYFHLQIIQFEEYSSKSEVNSVKAKTKYAPRGLILDRNGVILVENFPTYILTVTPYELKNKDIQFKIISEITNTPLELLNYRFEKYNRGKFLPTVLAKNLTFKEISAIDERRTELSGFDYDRLDERMYNEEFNDIHLLGYLRELDNESLSGLNKTKLYRAGELIGWQGIEKQYEEELRYSKGINYINVDTYGREVSQLTKKNIPAYPGKNIHLTIESKLQKFAKTKLKDSKGVILVSNVDNGEILAMVSNPSYNLNIYRGETSNKKWDELIKNENKPLINRSISGLYPPGSSFKLITAFNLVQNKLIEDNHTVFCDGSYFPEGSSRSFKCWKGDGHGMMDLNNAISQSCNIYFYETVQLMKLNDWVATANNFGFNEETNIDLPNELSGQIPDKDFFTKNYGRWGWSERGVLLNLTLGQGDILITPLQSLKFINQIASRGKTPMLKLNLNKDIEYYDKIDFSDQSWNKIFSGLYDGVNSENGTAWRAIQNNTKLFGKTSTAENPHGEPHAWFMGFFEYQDQMYSIVVLIENGGGGGAVASP
jgi:penicillin-binding protein 2